MIRDALAFVLERIRRAAEAASRDPASVRLVAVSKTKPASAIREAYAAGQRDFGENYAQELAQKAEELADLAEIRWHFIGHLQSNKARVIAPMTHLLHTVDSPSLAKELDKRVEKAGRSSLDVLVEVNVGGEAQKHGATPGSLSEVVAAIEATKTLRLRGLMTMPPHDFEGARRSFEALVSLRATHGGKSKLPELSMGMSDDLEVAVACGATLVRVGTAIFGAR
jgi:pyridoxal phosphate enzyme (YggS family)